MAYDFIFANNATTTLAQSLSSTTTVITVASGEGTLFPSPSSGQAFAVTLVDAETGLTNEICYCTSRSGDELTVVRGQEGSNSIAWSAGDTIANFVTAGTLGSFTNSTNWTTVHGQSGYRVCPDGEIEMWGLATVPASGATFSQVNVKFPASFPNMCYGAHGTSRGIANASGGWPSVSADNVTTTGCRLTAEVFGNTNYTFTNSVNIFWTARGY